jgi:hypothetical protein
MFVRLLAVCLAASALCACGGSDGSNSSTGGSTQATSVSSTYPTISGSPATTIAADSAYSFTPTVTNPSGGALTFSIKNMPSWARFDTQTGQLSGTPTSTDVGYDPDVEISVSDGTSTAALPAFGITVTAASSSASAPTVSLSAGSTSVTSGGGTSLSWTSANASSCTASGGWSGAEATSGSQSTGALSASTTYTLTCTGTGGSATQSVTVSVSSAGVTAGNSCTATSGSLQLSAKVSRATGISPLLVFFDATATTDSSVQTSVTQDVAFKWSFGDTGASGSGTWAYGSNPAGNSMNAGSGVVAAHLYRTAGSDTGYTATVTATDGTSTASCSIGVTAYDPGGSNGFAGAATTCISSSGTPVAGSGGCPAGAGVLSASSIQAALSSAYGNGKRLLFKCGDTFTGDNGGNDNLTATQWAIGAYGGCQDTQTNRPIFSNSGSNYIFQFGGSNGAGTLSDFDCEGNNSGGGGCIWADTSGVMYQDTIYNAYSNREAVSYNWAQCSQCGAVQVVQTGMGPGTTQIGSYFNFSGYAGYPYSGNVFNNVNYTAVIGSHFDGGTTYANTNAETVRISECAYCYLADNDFANSGTGGFSQLKIHEENPYNTESTWVGQYTQYMEISDNYFYGNTSAYDLELEPQNSNNDERLRYIVAERNIFAPSQALQQVMISGVNITARDNAFIVPAIDYYAIQVAQRGIEPAPQQVEIYNNSFYSTTCNVGAGYCNGVIGLTNNGQSGATQPSNSYAKNNLVYFPAGATVVVNAGSANSVSNNTVTFTNNPGWTNASGTMDKITDWRPAANYSGGTSVPVFFDALGDALGALSGSSWYLGAVQP